MLKAHSIMRNMKNSRSVVPKINIQDAIKQRFESSKYEYIIAKDRNNLLVDTNIGPGQEFILDAQNTPRISSWAKSLIGGSK
mgnify:CR=1 FL=1